MGSAPDVLSRSRAFLGSSFVADGLEILCHLLELLPGLIPPGCRPQQLNQHAPNLLASGELVGKQLHRLKCLVELAQSIHPLQKLDQVPLGLD